MAADAGTVYVGELDTSKLARQLTLNVSRFTTGTTQFVARYGASLGSWACSIKRAIGPCAPQDFPTPLDFTASIFVQPAADAADLSGTETLVWTTDVVGTGIVDIYFTGKADN